MIIDNDAFSMMPLQILLKSQDSNGAEEVQDNLNAMNILKERLNGDCLC